MSNTDGRYARTLEMPEEWRGRISQALQQPHAPATEAAWLRAAIVEKLENAQNAKELREMEERTAATLARVVDTLDRLQQSVQSIQAQLALEDTINKLILTYLPEPANMQVAQEIGQRRYARAAQFTSGDRLEPQTRTVRRDMFRT